MSESTVRIVCTDVRHAPRKHVVATWHFDGLGFGPERPASRSQRRRPTAGTVNLVNDRPAPEGATPFSLEHGEEGWRSKVDLSCRLCGRHLQLRDATRLGELLDKAQRAGLVEVELKHLEAILLSS